MRGADQDRLDALTATLLDRLGELLPEAFVAELANDGRTDLVAKAAVEAYLTRAAETVIGAIEPGRRPNPLMTQRMVDAARAAMADEWAADRRWGLI
jgi:hypothetical protein